MLKALLLQELHSKAAPEQPSHKPFTAALLRQTGLTSRLRKFSNDFAIGLVCVLKVHKLGSEHETKKQDPRTPPKVEALNTQHKVEKSTTTRFRCSCLS